MRVYETNLYILKPHLEIIHNVLRFDAVKVSRIYNKELRYEVDLGMLKDNNEFIKVAKALNRFGIGVVPFEY